MIELGPIEIAIATALILINAGVSLALRLDLEWKLLLASVRTVVQMFLAGFVLGWIFELRTWYGVTAILLVMCTLAAHSAVRRTDYRFPGVYGLSFLAMGGTAWVVTLIAVFTILRLEVWYEPRYTIPLLGMLLGNSVTGISLGLQTWSKAVKEEFPRIEVRLAAGATPWEASHQAIRNALRTGMIPILNSMMIVGIVSLPGMTTGQLLAGADPTMAVRYQILIMFMIAATTALGTLIAVLLSYRRSFGSQKELRRDLYQKVG